MRDACDVFFSYHWRDHAAVERIARRLIHRNVSIFLDRWYLAPGQLWPQALEAALARCRAVAVFLGAEGLGPWQQREKDLALDRQGREPGFPVIPVLLTRSDPGLGFLKLNTWVDLSEGAEYEAALDILAAAIRRQAPGPLALQQKDVRATICPYRGLRPFREEDEPFFFGRTAFTETLATTLAGQAFVAVVGASGSGKSSVVRAGLIPRLRRGEDGRIWEAVSFVPTDRPLASLAASLLPLLEPDLTEVDRLAEVGKLARHLVEGEVRLRDVTSRILAKQPGTERLLLFADQWEELYTLCLDETIRTAFIAQLLEVARSAAVTVVLTLRGDFMGHALAHRELSDQLHSIVTIGPMTRNELVETITKPADKMGLAFEPGLVETILDDVGDEPGSLPLLEFLLEALWQERRGALLHYDAYQKLGRVAGAIAHRADEVFTRELDDNQRQAAQRLLIRMVRPGEGVEDTRQRAAMPEADPVAEATIRKLADARLVVTERDAASGRETVEVAHEALIRDWQRLRGWVDEDREFLRTRERIATQARLWEDEGRPPDRLLPPGRPLAEGEDLLATRRADLDADLLTYIEVSTTAAKAEEDAARAVQHRRLRKARLVSAAMGLLALAAIGSGTIAWWQRAEANRNAEEARRNAEEVRRYGEKARSESEARTRDKFIYAADTGLAARALATLLKYQYGDPVSEKDVAWEMMKEYVENPELWKGDRHLSLLNLKRYLDSHGYDGIGYYRLRFADLVEKAPLLVPIGSFRTGRLVVFLSVIQDNVLLADPMSGNIVVSRDNFESAWLDDRYFGKVGFVVKRRRDGTVPPNHLGPSATKFIINIDGDGELLLSNADGENIGVYNGRDIDQISDAEIFLNETKDSSSKEYYCFYKQIDLTAEISGKSVGKYDFVRISGDESIHLFNVPTAENVNDTISMRESGEFSISFDSELNRNGEYHLSMMKNFYGWTQFEAPTLPVIPGATFAYRIDWQALRAGEKGVRIEVDENSDGSIDFAGTAGAELDDSMAPTTTPNLSGNQLSTGSYLPGATLTLIAADNEGGIGVDETEYSLDNGSNWTTYTRPFVFNELGEITLTYRSRETSKLPSLSVSASPPHKIRPADRRGN